MPVGGNVESTGVLDSTIEVVGADDGVDELVGVSGAEVVGPAVVSGGTVVGTIEVVGTVVVELVVVVGSSQASIKNASLVLKDSPAPTKPSLS